MSAPLSVLASKRVQKEILKFNDEANDENLTLEVISPSVWHVSFTGARGTLYEGEDFLLRIEFTSEYPMDSPIVVFLGNSPEHEHVYSNGHICLNILGDDWSPALTAKSVCLSIVSMLSSATKKDRPKDDARYSKRSGNPKNTKFVYHDDEV